MECRGLMHALKIVIVAAAIMGSTGSGMAETNSPLSGFLRVTKENLPILIDNPSLTFSVGDHLPLFQENDKYFVAILPDEEEVPRLVAFRLVQMGTRRAWVTSEAIMYFAYDTSSSRGLLYLDLDEELPVLSESKSGYEVLVTRFNRTARLWIPRRTRHMEYTAFSPRRDASPIKESTKEPPLSINTNEIIGTIKSGGKTYYIYKDDSQVQYREETSVPTTLSSSLGRFWPFSSPKELYQGSFVPDATAQEPFDGASDHTSPNSSALYTQKPPAAVSSTAPVLQSAPDTNGVSASVVEARQSPSSLNAWAHRGCRLLGTYRPVLVAALLALSAIVLLRTQSSRKRRPKKAPDAKPVSRVEDTDPGMDAPKSPPTHKEVPMDLTGSLSSMPLGSLAQLLNTERETGVLAISDEQKRPVGTMTFIKGDLIDAKTPALRGTEAVYDLVRRKTGSFSFKRGPGIGSQRTVQESTMPLILDAYRRADEQGS